MVTDKQAEQTGFLGINLFKVITNLRLEHMSSLITEADKIFYKARGFYFFNKIRTLVTQYVLKNSWQVSFFVSVQWGWSFLCRSSILRG